MIGCFYFKVVMQNRILKSFDYLSRRFFVNPTVESVHLCLSKLIFNDALQQHPFFKIQHHLQLFKSQMTNLVLSLIDGYIFLHINFTSR